jgi:hypothetical protein
VTRLLSVGVMIWRWAAVASVRVNFAVGLLAPSDIGILGGGFAKVMDLREWSQCPPES